MTALTLRARYLAGAALGLGLTALTPQQAMAACTYAGGVYSCTGTTTTTDTVYPANTPNDRTITFPAGPASNANIDVDPGAVVNGFGLALTTPGTVGPDLHVINDGTIQVNAGNTPTTGGSSAALSIVSAGTSITYAGTGDIFNLGTGDGLHAETSDDGSITVALGGSVTSTTADAVNLELHGTSGNISLTTTAGETIRAGGEGIEASITNAANAGSITVTNNAAILSVTGAPNTLGDAIDVDTAGTGAITVVNNGAIGSATDRAGTGFEIDITNAASAAALSVTGTGAVFAEAGGIGVDNAGTGTTTINYTGALDVSAGDGIDATATTGAMSVTTGAITAVGGNGILTNSTTGNQTISVGGNVTSDRDGVNATSSSGTIAVTTTGGADITGGDTGIELTTTGAKTVTIGTGSVVTGTTQAISGSGGGTLTVNNSGTVGTAGGLAVFASGSTTTTVNNLTGGVMNGRVDLSGNNDAVVNAGTWNVSGANNFLGGTDSVTNQSGGTINVAAGTSFTLLETFGNAGTINAANGMLFDAGVTTLNNTGTINLAGTLDMGAGADTLANTGAGVINLTANSTLAGVDTFTQSGRINLNTFTLTGTGAFSNLAGGFIDTSGSAGLAGFTSLSNAGTLDLAAGTFTVPAVVFTNSGLILADEGAATITGQTSFANSGTIDLQDGATGDVLTINSAFSGSAGSTLLVDFSGTTADRLVITGAASGATTVNATFVGGGLLNLDGVLVADTASSSANAFVLGTISNPNPLVDYSLVQTGADYFLVSAPNAALFNPLSVPVLAGSFWYQSADEVIANTRLPAVTSGISVWGQVYGGKDEVGGNDTQVIDGVAFDTDNELDTKRLGIQGAVDYGWGNGRLGVTAGWGRANADGDSDVELDADGWNIGIYGQMGGTTGFHGEFLAKYDRYKLEFDDGLFDGVDSDARSAGIDGSLGYRFGLGGAAVVDANVGLSHVSTKIDDIEAFGFDYDIRKLTSTRGRAGLRASFGGKLAPYVDATVYREFDGDGRIALFDGANTFDLEADGKATWVRLEGGITGSGGPGPMLAAWADLGNREGFGVRAGWRFGGASEQAMPLPPLPPAPPAPAAPATQTCPDGTVILATDACPPPPAPPAPPPPPVERGERG